MCPDNRHGVDTRGCCPSRVRRYTWPIDSAEVLFMNPAMIDGPVSMAVLLCLGHSWKLYWYSWTWATASLRMRYLVWSWGACVRFSRFREPVSAVVYRRHRALAAHVPLRAVCPPPGPAG